MTNFTNDPLNGGDPRTCTTCGYVHTNDVALTYLTTDEIGVIYANCVCGSTLTFTKMTADERRAAMAHWMETELAWASVEKVGN